MGQRSQIYVRHNGNLLFATYYQWNFAERMISRARWGIEYLKDLVDNRYKWCFTDAHYVERIKRVFDVNFDMHDVAIGTDIEKEYMEYGDGSTFSDYVFNKQDNTDGQLYVDIQDDKIYYGFRWFNEKDYAILDGNQYMNADLDTDCWHIVPEHNPAFDDCYLTSEDIDTCKKNIAAIESMAELMDGNRMRDFIEHPFRAEAHEPPAHVVW